MKNVLIAILFLSIGNNIFAQCISGDCNNGYRTYLFDFGEKYTGQWKDGKMHGHGTYYIKNGTMKPGLWENGQLKYDKFGCIAGDCDNGYGTYLSHDGSKYVGQFSNGKENGQGTSYRNDGSIFYSGDWKNGVINRGKGIQGNTTTQNNTTTSSSSSGKVIQLTKNGGVYEIPVSINGVLNIFFILDSGASEVSISRDVALTLIRTKTIVESDFLEGQTYSLADGSTVRSERFKIKKLVIGDFTLYDVSASISNSDKAPMLLGQNVLSRLGKIQIDYTNHTLTVIK